MCYESICLFYHMFSFWSYLMDLFLFYVWLPLLGMWRWLTTWLLTPLPYVIHKSFLDFCYDSIIYLIICPFSFNLLWTYPSPIYKFPYQSCVWHHVTRSWSLHNLWTIPRTSPIGSLPCSYLISINSYIFSSLPYFPPPIHMIRAISILPLWWPHASLTPLIPIPYV